MLPKSARLARKDFPVRGVRRRFAFGTLVLLQNNPGRFAVIVSKKVAPSAVDRNRLKRRLYAVMRGLSGAGAAIYPDKRALRAPHAELAEALREALQEARRFARAK